MRKSMMKKLPLVFATALCAAGLQACFVDSNHYDYDCRTEYTCSLECSNYCETRTDGWFEWDDCWETCEDVCHPYEVCEPIPECRYDRDCRAGGVCRSGVCHNRPVEERGYANLCESCNTGSDCRESGALCMELDNNERVCGRSCSNNNDCPSNYDCLSMEGMNAKQCVPRTFSCTANYCKTSRDCGENAECENNRCVLAKTNLSECQNYQDCKGYSTVDGSIELNICVKYTDSDGNAANYCTLDCYSDNGCDAGYYCYLEKKDLESGICFRGTEHGCVYDSDCASIDKSMICRNSKCSVPCNSDRDCASPSNGFVCDHGACVYRD